MKNYLVKDRLVNFIRYLGIPVSVFEKNVGLSNGYVYNFKGNIGSKKLTNILNSYPQLNKNWLLIGEGDMIKEEYNKTQKNRIGNKDLDDKVFFLNHVYNEAVFVGKVKNKMEFANLLGISNSALSRALHGNISYLNDILIAKVHNLHSTFANEVHRRKTEQTLIGMQTTSHNQNSDTIISNGDVVNKNYGKVNIEKNTMSDRDDTLQTIDILQKQIDELKADKAHLQKTIDTQQRTIEFLQKKMEDDKE